MKSGVRHFLAALERRLPLSHAITMAIASVALCLLTGCFTAAPRPKYKPVPAITAEVSRTERNLRVFDSAWNLVNELYYDAQFNGIDWRAARERHRTAAREATDDEQLYRSINSMLGELKDSHTGAISPHVVNEQRKHHTVSLGIELYGIQGSPDKYIIDNVWPGGPAADASVKTGWILETCNNQPARPFMENGSLQEGQTVQCTFLDAQDQPRQATLIARTAIRPPVHEARQLAHGIVYLRFDHFDDPSLQWLLAQLQTHAKAPAIILDLRWNGGGLAQTLQDAASAFLPRYSSLGTDIRHEKSSPSRAYRLRHTIHFLGRDYLIADLRPGLIYQGRLAVLTSKDSASCSEVFADAIKHYHRGVIIGTKTAGAVLGMREIKLPDGGKLNVSTDDFRSPAGHRLEGVGVEPDITVHHTYDFLRAGINQDIEAALVELQKPLLK